MELKDFQKTSLERIKKYLELVRKEQDNGNARHASADAWQEVKKVFLGVAPASLMRNIKYESNRI